MNTHETQLIQVHPNGQVEFFCPLCEYHIIIGDGAVMVLDGGDPLARHSEIAVTDAEDSDPRLDVFDEFIRGLDEAA